MSNRLHHLLLFIGLLLINGCQTVSKQEAPHTPSSDGGLSNKAPDIDSGNGSQNTTLPDTDFQSKVCSRVYSAPTPHSTLPGSLLLEISGLSPSGANENILWAHNDSGDAAQIYAVHKNGSHLATVQLSNVVATDIEDMASGVCPGGEGFCLYIADVGDNRHERGTLQIHILKEPSVNEALSAQLISQVIDKTIQLTFSGEKPNIEAFVVNTQNHRGYLFEKADNQLPRLFVVDLEGNTQQALTDLTTFPAPKLPNGSGINTLITAGAYHSNAKRLVLKTYAGIFEYRFIGDQTLENIADVTPITVAERPAWELQGEAITYSYWGDTILSASEDPSNSGSQQVSSFLCEP
jgi:hypothetical protein